MKSREIKFRVWHKKNRRMLRSVINPYNFRDQESRFILMQFIGRKDINGKEIYEGDIFDCIYKRDGCKHKLMVIWSISDASFRIRNCGKCDQPNVRQSVFDIQRKEVIGNVYENPKLLNIKGEEELKLNGRKENINSLV